MNAVDPVAQPITDNSRFRMLVDAVSDYAIFMLDPTGTVISWNSGAQRIKGYRAEEIIGEHFSRFYPDEDRASGLPARALEIAAREGRFEHEGWRVRKDGSPFWASVVIDPIRDPGGTLAGYAKVTRDLTERKLAEDALRRSQEQFQLLVQGVTDYAIYMLDPQGHITSWNTGAQRIKGYTEQEIVGQHFSRFYTDEERAAGLPQKSLDAATREGRYEREGWRVRKDGSRFWASVVIDPIRDANGTLIGYAKVTRDLTERRATEEALEQARAALFQAQKMEAIGQLTGGIAHDFNNLLTVVVNGLDLLARKARDPKETKVIEGMHRAADRGKRLNQQLLAFARRQPLRPQTCNPNSVITGFEAVLRRACGETIQVEMALGRRVRDVNVDVPQFEAALLNLVVNARDAMEGGGKLRISTRNMKLDQQHAARTGLTPGTYVSIVVADSGSGMPEEVRARAFEPFFTTKEVGKGTGLGLSQVYGFVAQSGGQVEIESDIGQGTRVHLLIPATEAGETGDHEEEDSAHEARTTIGTVLIVEDEADVLDIAVEIFDSLGYDVLSARDASAALELLRQNPTIDVLFSDVVMPGAMNGVELAREARRMRPELKVLLASGYPMSAMSGQGLDPEVSFISKPYRWTELDEKLRALRTRGT